MLKIFNLYYPIRNVFFFIGEGLIIYISVILAFMILPKAELFAFDQLLYLKIFLVTFICQTCLYYYDFYNLKVINSFLGFSIRMLQALGVAAIFLAGIYVIFPGAIIGYGIFAFSIGFVMLFIISWRFCYKFILEKGIFDQKIIVLGSGNLAKSIIDEIEAGKDNGYILSANIQEYSENNNIANEKNTPSTIYKDDYEGLCGMAKEFQINKIVVALTEKRGALPTKELVRCRINGIEIIEGVSFYEMLTGKFIVEQINPAWLIFSEGFYKSRTRCFLKRTMDLILSSVLIILFSPVIIATAVLIKIDSKGPVIFKQDRVGKNKKTYLVYKFRSMFVDSEKHSGPVWAEDNDLRITRIGKVIRKYRVDEIPQLWNVLKGDMSFVGPRPEREFFVQKLEAIIPYFKERFSVKPGITGWAQVSYGYGASVEDAIEKLNYDLFYIKNMSIFMDLMIAMRTIKIVLF